MSTSAFWLRSGCWPWNGFDFQAVSSFSTFSLAISLDYRAFSVFFISTSNLVSRSTSFSHANSAASFTTECEPFSFLSFKLVVASSNLINSSIAKDQSSIFYQTVWFESNPLPRYFFRGKDNGHGPLGDACCVFSSSF